MTALDISSIVPQVQRQLPVLVSRSRAKDNDEQLCVYIMGCGKSGIAAMAAVRASIYSNQIKIITSDIDPQRIEDCRELCYADVCEELNAHDIGQTLTFVHDHTPSKLGADLVINTTNATFTESASILAAENHGTVILFSMATQFDRAALAPDALGKDVQILIGVGIADNQDSIILDLLRNDKRLQTYFAKRI